MKKLTLALLGAAALAAVAVAPSAAYAACEVGNCWGAVAYGPGGAWFESGPSPVPNCAGPPGTDVPVR